MSSTLVAVALVALAFALVSALILAGIEPMLITSVCVLLIAGVTVVRFFKHPGFKSRN